MFKTIVFIFTLTIAFGSLSLAQEKTPKEKEETMQRSELTASDTTEISEKLPTEIAWNKVCPVRGNPIEDDTPVVEYDGKIYGFCCPGCDTKFADNPEKYSKNLNEDGTRFVGRR